MMVFASREHAGLRLGEYLRERKVAAELVLGLPRGGVVVAAEVARALNLPLDVLLVRKIGHPLHREFAVGALAEQGIVLLDESTLGRHPAARAQLDEVIEEEKGRLRSYQARFHPDGGPSLADKAVLLVDDGIATGSTTEAAVQSVRKQQARKIIVAAPVASTNAVERLGRLADEVQVMCVDPDFEAVGQYYERFSQTTDQEVLELLQPAVKAHR
jgi:putative phosphoribosyl transferase